MPSEATPKINLLGLNGREEASSTHRYRVLKQRMIALMVTISIVPLCLMAAIDYYHYRDVLWNEVIDPLRALENKTKHSLELFAAERVSTVSFIASAYSFEQLSEPKKLGRILSILSHEFQEFVDLGLFDTDGRQVSYAGPYELVGKNYSNQDWFQEVKVKGVYISDVFMGHRRFPHIAIAVKRRTESGQTWILRATLNTTRFNNVIASMGLTPQSDAFLVNREGILQTKSKFFGGVFEKLPMEVPPESYQPSVIEMTDSIGREVILVYSYLLKPDFILMVVKPKGLVFRGWTTLRSELLAVFLVSGAIILLVVFRVIDRLIRRLRESDENREAAFREMEHSHKLSSIGRLAAGVAHEINNPIAVIGEKSGLAKDLMALEAEFPRREKFERLLDSILQSVERCGAITHRLLGFARRMEVQIEFLDLNSLLLEVLGFLEKEALYRNLEINVNMAEDLPRIQSDRGQLQQVFLNLINNAFAAVEEGGIVSISTFEKDADTVGAAIKDNGIGMTDETLTHIFEPFFTTKTGTGTGLGLSITYGIVKRLGGEIEVSSKYLAGSEFTVYLPKKSEEK